MARATAKMLREIQSKRATNFFIVARSLSGDPVRVNTFQVTITTHEAALRIAAKTRWSRVDEKGDRKAETQLAAQERMGRASCLVDALRRLELDLACH